MTVSSVPIASIHAAKSLWPRSGFDHERVAAFADLYREQGPAALPPVVLVREDDHYLLADGWHRTRAALVVNLTELPADVEEPTADVSPADLAYQLAVRHSTKSARPLSRAEVRAAIVRLTELHPDWSQHVVGRFVGVAHSTVGRVLARADAMNDPGTTTPGDEYVAAASAEELATRFFRGIEKIWEARGLGLVDSVVGDRTSERLARVLNDAYGDTALDRAQRYRAWITGAISQLKKDAR